MNLTRAKNRSGVFIKPKMAVAYRNVLTGLPDEQHGVVEEIRDEGGMAVADVRHENGELVRNVIVRYMRPD